MRNVFIILVLIAPCYAAAARRPLRVVIDPGHGGRDSGAVRGHLREDVICLSLAQKLAKLLQRDPKDFQVFLTRDHNETLSLQQRVAIANEDHADIVLSLHANVANNTNIAGPEFYVENQLPPDMYEQYLANRENKDAGSTSAGRNSEDALNSKSDVANIIDDLENVYRIKMSAELAETLQQNWTYPFPHHTKQVRQAPFYIVSKVHAPSALIEIGYLSSPKEGHLLANAKYQEGLASGIFKSLLDFKEVLDKQEAPRLN